MAVEAYTSVENTMKFYGNATKVGADLPLNFMLVSDLDDNSKAADFNNIVNTWLDNMPKGKWANWQVSSFEKRQLKSYLVDH